MPEIIQVDRPNPNRQVIRVDAPNPNQQVIQVDAPNPNNIPKRNIFQKAGDYMSAGSDPSVLDAAVQANDQPAIDTEMAGITRKAFNPFNPEKDTAGGAIGSIGQDVGEFISDIPQKIRRIPKAWERTATLRDPNVMFPTLTAGRAGDISATNMMAPITSKLMEGIDTLGEKGPLGAVAATAGSIPAFGLGIAADAVGTGASLGIDAFMRVIDLGRASLRGSFGQDKALDATSRLTRAVTTDQSGGKVAQERLAPKLEEEMNKQIAAGVDPVKAAGDMRFAMAQKGLDAEFSEEIVINALLFGIPAVFSAAKRVGRFNVIMAQRDEIRAIRASEELQRISGKYLALPEPGFATVQRTAAEIQRLLTTEGGITKNLSKVKRLFKQLVKARKNVKRVATPQPQAGPTAGPGFVVKQTGEPFSITRGAGPAEQVIEKGNLRRLPGSIVTDPKTGKPLAVQPTTPARFAGKTIDVEANVGGTVAQGPKTLMDDAKKAADIDKAVGVHAAPSERKFLVGPEEQAKAGRAKPFGKGGAPVELLDDTVPGKGFIAEPGGEKPLLIKGKVARTNIIEKSAREKAAVKSARKVALDKAAVEAKAARAAAAAKKPPPDVGGAPAKLPKKPKTPKDQGQLELDFGKKEKSLKDRLLEIPDAEPQRSLTSSEVRELKQSAPLGFDKIDKPRSLRGRIIKEAEVGKTSIEQAIKNRRGVIAKMERAGDISGKEASKMNALLDDVSMDVAKFKAEPKGLTKGIKAAKSDSLLEAEKLAGQVPKGFKPPRLFDANEIKAGSFIETYGDDFIRVLKKEADGSFTIERSGELGKVSVENIKLDKLLDEGHKLSPPSREILHRLGKSHPKYFEQRTVDVVPNVKKPVTPFGKAAKSAKKVVDERAKALDDVVDMAYQTEPSQMVRDAEGSISKVAGGFPEELGNKGYKTRDLNAVAKKVRAGKKLTERQKDIADDMMAVHEKMTGKRTLKDQLKDIGDLLDPPKPGQLNVGLPFGSSRKSQAAARRLAQDAKNAGKDFAKYLKEDLGKDDKEIKKIMSAFEMSKKSGGKVAAASEAEKMARVERQQQKIDMMNALRTGEVSETKMAKTVAQGSKEFLSEAKKMPDIGSKAASLDDVTITDTTVARGMKMRNLIRDGVLTEDEAKVIVKADEIRRRIHAGKGAKIVASAKSQAQIDDDIANISRSHKLDATTERHLRAAMAMDITEDTRIGLFPLGAKVSVGEVTSEEARMLMAMVQENPVLNLKTQVSDATRYATPATNIVREYLNLVNAMTPAETSILADVPASMAARALRTGLQQKLPISTILDRSAGSIETLNKVGALTGRTLRSFGNLRSKAEASELLRDMLKMKGVTHAQRNEILRQLELMGDPKKAGVLDVITEYGINAMLSALITFERNLVGGATGLVYQIPVKIGKAITSNIAAMLHIPMTERIYFREIIPEISAMIRAVPKSVKKGYRYFAYEDTVTILRNLEDQLQVLRRSKIHLNPQAEQIAAIKTAIRTAKANFKAAKKAGISSDTRAAKLQLQIAKKTKILSGRGAAAKRKALGVKKLKKVRSLKEAAKDLLTEEDLTRRAEIGRIPGRAIKGKLGFVLNTPVKILVATDKTLQGVSAEGHKAARLLRRAITQSKSKNPFAMPSVKYAKLSTAQTELAKTDALFYVFREKLGPWAGPLQNAISSVPGFPLLIPFFKSNTNFIKFAVKTSPFGFIDAVRKSVGSGKVDVESAGRALGGSAVSMAIYKYIKDNGGELHGPAKNASEREMLRMLNKGEMRIDWKHKGKVVRSTPFNSMAPLTIPLLVGSLIEGFFREKGYGKPSGKPFSTSNIPGSIASIVGSENFREQSSRLWKGLLQQSTFGNVNDMVNAIETLESSGAALTADGDPDGDQRSKGIVKWAEKFFAGKAVYNAFRESRQTGKFLGVIPVGEKDLTIFSNRGVSDELRTSFPRVGSFDPAKAFKIGPVEFDDVPVRKAFTGATAMRQEKMFPIGGILGRTPEVTRDEDGNVIKVNPIAKHFGFTPKNDAVLKELNKYEVFPKRAPTSATFKKYPIKLTEQEQREFNFLGDMLNQYIDMTIKYDPRYKALGDQGRKERLEEIVRDFRAKQSKFTKYKGLMRLLSSDEGFKELWYGRTKGFSPFQTNR